MTRFLNLPFPSRRQLRLNSSGVSCPRLDAPTIGRYSDCHPGICPDLPTLAKAPTCTSKKCPRQAMQPLHQWLRRFPLP